MNFVRRGFDAVDVSSPSKPVVPYHVPTVCWLGGKCFVVSPSVYDVLLADVVTLDLRKALSDDPNRHLEVRLHLAFDVTVRCE